MTYAHAVILIEAGEPAPNHRPCRRLILASYLGKPVTLHLPEDHTLHDSPDPHANLDLTFT